MANKLFIMSSKTIKNNTSLISVLGFLCLILFNSISCLAVSIDHLGKAQGLSNSNVHSIFRDSDGMIWVGTETDVNWYLGGEFNELTVQMNDTGGKISAVVHIFEDNDKGIWFFNLSNGIFRLDKRAWKLSKVTIKGLNIKLTELTGNQLFVDNASNIWLTTDSGVFSYDSAKQVLTAVPIADKQPDDQFIFNQILNFTDKQIALATSKGIYLWQAQQGQFVPLNNDILGHKEILKISSNGDYSWALTYKSVYKINNKTHETKRVFTIDSPVNTFFDMYIENDASYWLTGTNGIYHLSAENKKIRHFQPKRINKSKVNPSVNQAEGIQKIDGRLLIALSTSLAEYDYTSQEVKLIEVNTSLVNGGAGQRDKLISDTSGNLWIVTTKGVAKISFNRPTFNAYQFNPKSASGPNSSLNRAILYDSKHQLWLGSQDKGISRYNSQTKAWDYFSNVRTNSGSLSNVHVRALLEDKQGNIWAGVDAGGGLNLFNKDKKNWQHFKQGGLEDHIFNLHEGNEDNLWIGHGRGIASFSIKSQKFTNYSPVGENDTAPMVRAISQDRKNNLWVGTHFIKRKVSDKYTYARGLYKFNTISHQWQNFVHNAEQPDSLSNDFIFSINVDSHQDVWVGTWGGGINLLKNDGKTFQHYTMEDGLSSDVIYAIFEDKAGSLWISSAGGLNQIIPCHRRGKSINYQCKPLIKHYEFAAPLSEVEFDSESAFQADDGTLYFGGSNGVISFNPEKKMESNSYLPLNTFFNKLKIKGQSITPALHHGLDQWIGYADKLTLNYDDQPFSLSLANNEFTQPEKNQYRYRIDNGDWLSIDAKLRNLSFTRLASGQYKIEIDSRDRKSVV